MANVKSFEDDMPNTFPVAVLMECHEVKGNPWVSSRWEAIGIIVQKELQAEVARKKLRENPNSTVYLFDGLSITLYVDQAESYYHNLMMKSPRMFVVCKQGDSGEPIPMLVTASCDEANAYVEVDEIAYSVDPPSEFLQWIEHFVIKHYMPIKKTKRKLKNWKAGK